MVNLTSSTYVAGPVQIDGRVPITETHVIDGYSHVYDYLNDGTVSPQVVMEQRAAYLVQVLNEREAARALVEAAGVAIYKSDFLARFTAAERVAIKTNAATDPVTADFMLLMENADMIHKDRALPGLQYLQSIGLLTAQRAAEIGAW